MANEEYKCMKLKLSLERIAMLSITQRLWKSQDITNQVDVLLKENKIRHWDLLEMTKDPDCFKLWEELLDSVLEKVNALTMLPIIVQKDLKKLTVLVGGVIYKHYQKSREQCKWCESSAGTKAIHSYYFSSYGILMKPCSILHSRYVPKDHEILDFFHIACRDADEELVIKYQKEMIAHLESVKPGLNLRNKKDIVFNIICVWNYIYCHGVRGKRNRLPKKFLSNVDYVVPVKVIHKMIIYGQMEDKVFEIRAHIFFDLLPELELCKSPALDYRRGYEEEHYLYNGLKLLSQEFASRFFLTDVFIPIMVFLTMWPYEELIPQILDFYLKKNPIDKNYIYELHPAFECIIMAVGLQNRMKHSVRKSFYVELLKKIWQCVPSSDKLELLSDVIILGVHSFWLDISIIDLRKEDIDFNFDADTMISKKCKTFLEKENADEFLMKSLSEIVISSEDFDSFSGYMSACLPSAYSPPKNVK